MIYGDVGDGHEVLVRLHSECLTGDALGSLRCDCGVQLRLSMRLIAAAGRGVVVYVTGHEGRGIGLVNKLRAYVAQDGGADTVDANLILGLPIDSRDYTDAAAVLDHLGVRTVRLLSNNPHKVTGLTAAGVAITEVVPLPTAPHHRNAAYLNTKAQRMGHVQPAGAALSEAEPAVVEADVTALLGRVQPQPDRPYVVLKYAQTMDGRIATSTGDARWISGTAERTVSHALRAASDGVLVGVGTALQDDPELTVRMVAGASPVRIVLDSTLRTPASAKVLSGEAATMLITTARSDQQRRIDLRRRGVRVEVVADVDGLVSLPAALAALRTAGIECLLVEGGSAVITSLLAAGLVDRLIVAVSPVIVGAGTEAVGSLGIDRVADGIRLTNRLIVPVGEDVIFAWDTAGRSETAAASSAAIPFSHAGPTLTAQT
jgi:3,4-dihydroxy 2-butanone 4-phosphate synthase/GTP cyclohydrolase II